MHPLRPLAVGTFVLVAALSSACSAARSPQDAGPGTPAPSQVATAPTAVRPPAANAAFDYQLGGPYPPPDTVRAVSRDRTAETAPGLYNICYVNAFQAQPDDTGTWKDRHPELLLRDERGNPVIDQDWDEPLLDISTAAKRAALMDIIGPWIDGCAKAGYDAVEPDNLDSYERSHGRLTAQHAAAFAELLTRRAHQRQLAVAQKNTTDLLPRRHSIGFDFAVVEECAHYQECGDFADAYANRVFVIEYEKKDFAAACRAWGKRLSLTLRDRDVRPAGSAGHVDQRC
ncbi:endo alpha-1,4 polygalactosaminidase [Streptomyces inhibens]|uniref:endo alpha-1,4 polygalactosaminidase n=1 Tax=Streptomyces inhibens TaxID=2293571 RepID=UPI001EE70BDF|nr:endo alpha-1,4 polygalactosaminidase [Streptomyces inhibens]UKY47661.1 endo alpha-1,4 polygalactosaminidase [Streptomyces inhibens]